MPMLNAVGDASLWYNAPLLCGALRAFATWDCLIRNDLFNFYYYTQLSSFVPVAQFGPRRDLPPLKHILYSSGTKGHSIFIYYFEKRKKPYFEMYYISDNSDEPLCDSLPAIVLRLTEMNVMRLPALYICRGPGYGAYNHFQYNVSFATASIQFNICTSSHKCGQEFRRSPTTPRICVHFN